MGFGERLQREREMRRITLDEIATATKIGTRSLRALEEEDFKKLPGGIFNKGFVRAYARYLGIDEEEAVADYLAAIGEPDDGEAPLDQDRLKKIEASWKPPKRDDPGEGASARVPWAAIVLLLVIVGGVFVVWHFGPKGVGHIRQWWAHRHPQSEMNQQNAVAPQPAQNVPVPVAQPTATVAQGPAAAAATPTTATPAAPPVTANSSSSVPSTAAPEFVVQVRAREDSWVSIVADGKPVLKGMLKATREEAVHAHEKIVLTAGNAAGIELLFNGKPQPALGDANQVRTVTFTPDGQRSDVVQ